MLAGSKKLSSILTVTSWPCAQAEGAKINKATRESVASSSSRLIWGSSLFGCPFPYGKVPAAFPRIRTHARSQRFGLNHQRKAGAPHRMRREETGIYGHHRTRVGVRKAVE